MFFLKKTKKQGGGRGRGGVVFCGVDSHVNPETLKHLIRSEWAWRWEIGRLLRRLSGTPQGFLTATRGGEEEVNEEEEEEEEQQSSTSLWWTESALLSPQAVHSRRRHGPRGTQKHRRRKPGTGALWDRRQTRLTSPDCAQL